MFGTTTRLLGLIGLTALCTDPIAIAAERVQFESARYQAGPLQLRRARERGETVAAPTVDRIDGYLTKPQGNGPFPAIVHLHGCEGLPKDFKSGADKDYWSEQLAASGYVILVVDSFTSRGIEQACADAATSNPMKPPPMTTSLEQVASRSFNSRASGSERRYSTAASGSTTGNVRARDPVAIRT